MLSRLRAAIRAWLDVGDPEERIEGSGKVYLDPAYNEQYEAEQNLQRYAELEDADEERTRQP